MSRPDPPPFPDGRRIRVAVLMGGTSNERQVSLSTGRQIVSALDPTRYEVAALDTQDILPAPRHEAVLTAEEVPVSTASGAGVLTDAFTPTLPLARDWERGLGGESRPDVVFIALHGKGGEDGTVQGMLELLGLPYTGSGVLASALAMNKGLTKKLFRAQGIPVLRDMQVHRGQTMPEAELIQRAQDSVGPLPLFVKPNAEGSTFGCTFVTEAAQLPGAVAKALEYDEIALIEAYARGTEITVGVLGNNADDMEALPIIEIVPKAAYYDYESKYADGGSEHIVPARLPEHLMRRAQQMALACHRMLGCRGMSRTDMIVSDGVPYVLEVNTIPGMTPTSLLPQAAEAAGISFPTLLDRLIAAALKK